MINISEYLEVNSSDRIREAAKFLSLYDWLFHGSSKLSVEQALQILSNTEHTSKAFLIAQSNNVVGLIRALDLDDIEDGSPMIDLRISPEYRNKGIASEALSWLVYKLFSEHDKLIRIEATTRDDNFPMQTVLLKCGFLLEGRLRKAWPMENGERRDTLIYGIVRG